jgi:osmotically inducible protein OsmC
MPVRKSEGHWTGGLRDGSGRVRLGSGAFEGVWSLRSRIEETTETNPEELIGAALATCFSMALAESLEQAGYLPRSLQTTALVDEGPTPAGFRIKTITLEIVGAAPGVDAATFTRLAEETLKTCPVGLALTGTELRVTARLEDGETP